MAFKHDEGIKIFKALADDNRLEILELLISGEKCGCELLEALNIGQSTLSHHMRILCEAGLVDACKEAKWKHESLSAEGAALGRKLTERYTLSPDKDRRYKKYDSWKK